MFPHFYPKTAGAGFYLNATESPFAVNYNMYGYVVEELPALIESEFPALPGVKSIFGHSMGGHGALTIGLKENAAAPGSFASISAFAPICNPTQCPWGVKAFEGYLGSVQAGEPHDATLLAKGYAGPPLKLLVDQGTSDNFLTGDVNQLQPDKLKAACAENAAVDLTLRMQDGYDHSYFFMSSFIDDHINYHADALGA